MNDLSGRVKTALFLYLLLCFAGGLAGLFALMGGALKSPVFGIDMTAVRVYLYYACSGGAGGSLYALRMFHQFYDQMTMRFVYWYMVRPFVCAGTGAITIILFESGILLLQVTDSLYAKIGVAFLAGFGYGKLMEKLAMLTETFFNGNGRNGGCKPPGPSA